FCLWQFKSWKNILKKDWVYYTLIAAICAIWTTENIIFGKLTVFGPAFQISYCMILILLAVNQLNWLLVNERGNIMKNPIFLICIGMIIYYSYKVLTEVFYYYAPE